MTCQQVRTCLVAFLDSELDRARSMEVQRHLDACCCCAREAEIEREIRHAMTKAIAPADMTVPPLEPCMRKALRSRSKSRIRQRSPASKTTRRTAIGAVVTTVVLTLVVGHFWFSQPHTEDSFVDMLVDDVQAVWAGHNPLTITTHDYDELTRWIRQTVDWDLTVTKPGEPVRLLGARSCEFNGKQAVFVLYDLAGQPLSLIVLDDQKKLSGMKPMHANADCYIDQCKGYTVMAMRRDDLTHFAVGKLSAQHLMRLLEVPSGKKL